ncbi:MAG: esterase [Lachnospiraceae bacterium]|nr:esterase [Lachnospiraceae bacterium]
MSPPQPVDEHDAAELAAEYEEITKRAGVPVILAAYPIESWQNELSPWEAPPVFGKDGFGNGAADTLSELTENILPYIRDRFGFREEIPVILGGYSLAGLFALWAGRVTDVFRGIAAASPSVWFPGWIRYASEHGCLADCVYLSLGNREERARNPVMASVGRCIREQHEILIKEEIPCTLEWNEGNHFVDAPVRSAKAFSWCIQTIKKKQNQ